MQERSAGRRMPWGWVALAGGALAGCGGGPEPLPPSHREQWLAREAAAAKTARETPSGTLAPVDEWRRRLTEELPAPWRLGSIDAQVIAPAGWTKLKGDRGLVVWAQDGKGRQTYWVLPVGWEGKVFDPKLAAHEIARNERFILFAPHEDAPGWGATEVLKSALGFGAEVAQVDPE